MEKNKKIAVIGGGIAGVTFALCMEESGYECHVYEKNPEYGELGAAISIFPNTMYVLNKAVTVFDKIAEGTYALSVFHDSQNTGKLRTNVFEIPRDGYGFSNDAMGIFGPPSFAKAAFKVTAGKNNVSIKLR